MSAEQRAWEATNASSTGQAMTGADWLDGHFEACRPEYEAMLRSVGLQPGWRVLDAGSGSGSFLPLIAGVIGPAGQIVALDLAPENIAIVERRRGEWQLSTPLEMRVSSVLALPYPDAVFDAVWFAITAQYLTDDELAVALVEFRRVVRSGGVVAAKEFDATLARIIPAPPLIGAHIGEGMLKEGMINATGCLRARALATWLRQAGFQGVWMRSTLVERGAPLGQYERQYCEDNLRQSASLALTLDIPAEDRVVWERLAAPAERARLLDDPDFYWCEGHVLTVGTAP